MSRELSRAGNIFIVTLRPAMNGDLCVEAVHHIRDDIRPQAMMLRHRFNQDMRAGWFKAPASWTHEDVAQSFEDLGQDAMRRFYNQAVNLG